MIMWAHNYFMTCFSTNFEKNLHCLIQTNPNKRDLLGPSFTLLLIIHEYNNFNKHAYTESPCQDFNNCLGNHYWI